MNIQLLVDKYIGTTKDFIDGYCVHEELFHISFEKNYLEGYIFFNNSNDRFNFLNCVGHLFYRLHHPIQDIKLHYIMFKWMYSDCPKQNKELFRLFNDNGLSRDELCNKIREILIKKY